MRNRTIPRLIVLALACGLFASRAARASDDVRGEVAGGYAYLSVGTCSAQSCNGSNTTEPLPHGWFASGGAILNGLLAVVGEASGNYKSSSDSLGDTTATASLRLHSFLGGARVLRRSRRLPNRGVTVFGQFLVGVASTSAGVTATGPGVSLDVRSTETDFCYQPGGGIDVDVSSRAAIRLGADVRFIRAGGAASREFQVVAGAVYRFGR